MNYKVGDWVIHRYEIAFIKKMEGDRVREVSTGYISCSGMNLTDTVRPLTPDNKVIAESFKSLDRTLHQTRRSNSLNWPDIHRYLCDLCLKEIDAATGERGKYINEANEFVRKTQNILEDVDSINGISIFR